MWGCVCLLALWPWGGAAERVLACSRSKALWFFLFFFSAAGAAFLGRPRFLLFNLRPLDRSRALRGLAEGLTTVTKLGRSSSPQESCCNTTNTHTHTCSYKAHRELIYISFTSTWSHAMLPMSYLVLFFRFRRRGAIAFTVLRILLLTSSSCLLLFLI